MAEALDLTFENLISEAKRKLLEEGEVRTRIFIVGEGMQCSGPMDDLDPDNKHDHCRSRGHRLAHAMGRQMGAIKLLLLASEAWALQLPLGTDHDKVPRPSQHPDRQEILTITELNCQTMQTRSCEFPMVRVGNSVDLLPEKRYTEEDNLKAELLEVFLDGYKSGLQCAGHGGNDVLRQLFG